MPGHKGSIWGLDISTDGFTVVSCGQDRSIRFWTKNDDLVFVEEEKDRALEAEVDKAAIRSDEQDKSSEGNSSNMISEVTPSIKSVESIRSGEILMESLDLVERELQILAEENGRYNGPTQIYSNPLLLGLTPHQYLLRSLRMIKAADMEQTMLLLPFHYVSRLIKMLIELAEKGLDLELCSRCSIFLIRAHQSQILATHALLPEINRLKNVLIYAIGDLRTLVGANVAAFKYVSKLSSEKMYDFNQDGDSSGNNGEMSKRKKRNNSGLVNHFDISSKDASSSTSEQKHRKHKPSKLKKKK